MNTAISVAIVIIGIISLYFTMLLPAYVFTGTFFSGTGVGHTTYWKKDDGNVHGFWFDLNAYIYGYFLQKREYTKNQIHDTYFAFESIFTFINLLASVFALIVGSFQLLRFEKIDKIANVLNIMYLGTYKPFINKIAEIGTKINDLIGFHNDNATEVHIGIALIFVFIPAVIFIVNFVSCLIVTIYLIPIFIFSVLIANHDKEVASKGAINRSMRKWEANYTEIKDKSLENYQKLSKMPYNEKAPNPKQKQKYYETLENLKYTFIKEYAPLEEQEKIGSHDDERLVYVKKDDGSIIWGENKSWVSYVLKEMATKYAAKTPYDMKKSFPKMEEILQKGLCCEYLTKEDCEKIRSEVGSHLISERFKLIKRDGYKCYRMDDKLYFIPEMEWNRLIQKHGKEMYEELTFKKDIRPVDLNDIVDGQGRMDVYTRTNPSFLLEDGHIVIDEDTEASIREERKEEPYHVCTVTRGSKIQLRFDNFEYVTVDEHMKLLPNGDLLLIKTEDTRLVLNESEIEKFEYKGN